MSEQTRPSPASGRRWLAIALAAAALTSVGAALWARAVARTTREAQRALETGRYAEAQDRSRRWLRLRPGSADADYVIARAALALGQGDVFRESSRRALAAGLSQPRRQLLGALVDAGRGRYQGTEPALLAAIAAGEGPDPQIDEALARVYLETFRLRQAEGILDRWAAEAQDDPKPYLWRAEIDRRVGHGPEFLEIDYRKALERAPGAPAARLGRADALRALRRYEEAKSEYAAYLRLRPVDPSGHLGAAEAALALGDDAGAARHLDRALALDPHNVPGLTQASEAAARRGDVTAALSYLDRAVELAPYEVDVRYKRSLLLSRLDRRDDAAKEQAVVSRLRSEYGRLNELKQGLLRSPQDDDLKAEIGRWMLEHGHDDEGRRWSEDVLRQRPGHPLANQVLEAFHSRRGEIGLANFYRLRADEGPR